MSSASGGRADRVNNLLADYAILVDSRQATAWAELFTDEGTLVLDDRRIEGRADLETFAAGSPAGVHIGSVGSVRDEGDLLLVHSSFVYVGTDGRLIAGTYTDRIEDDGSTARFVERTIAMSVRRATAEQAAPSALAT